MKSNDKKKRTKEIGNIIAKKTDGVEIRAKDRNVKVILGETAGQEMTGLKTCAQKLVMTSTLAAIGQGFSSKEMEEKGKQIYSAMKELKPRDGYEGFLISQMVTVYFQAMDCFSLANNKANKEYLRLYDGYLNQGVKLMRLYNQQLETLDKHRNKGKQKMTVEHVHIHKGGQAIVGNVNHGGGVNHEK